MSAAEFKQEVTKLLTKYPEESMRDSFEKELLVLGSRAMDEIVTAWYEVPEGEAFSPEWEALDDIADRIDSAFWDVASGDMTWEEFKRYVEDYPV